MEELDAGRPVLAQSLGLRLPPMGDRLGQAELLDPRRLPPAIAGSVLGATEVIPDRPLGDAQDSRRLAPRLVALVQNIDRHDLLPCELCQGDASERAWDVQNQLESPWRACRWMSSTTLVLDVCQARNDSGSLTPSFTGLVTPEGVLQIVVRPRQVWRLVALKQAGPEALGPFHEMLQARAHQGVLGRGRRLPHPHQQSRQTPPPLLRRQLVLIVENSGHALDPGIGPSHGHNAAVSSSPRRSNCCSRFRLLGKPPAKAATWSRLAAIRLSQSCHFSPEATRGARPS